MDVLQEEQELRLEQQVHVIPNDDNDDQSSVDRHETFVCPHSSAAQCHLERKISFYEDALEGFVQVGVLAREIGSDVIKREAASVNQRLIDVKDRMHVSKRRKLAPEGYVSTKTLSFRSFNERDLPVSEEEQGSILSQAARMKRMSLLLMNLETTHQLLLEEMMACTADLEAAEEE